MDVKKANPLLCFVRGLGFAARGWDILAVLCFVLGLQCIHIYWRWEVFMPIPSAAWQCACGERKQLIYDRKWLRFLACTTCDKEKIEARCDLALTSADVMLLREAGVKL